MANERLLDFPAKSVPVGADIVFVGDSADAFNEVKSTVNDIVEAGLSDSPSFTELQGEVAAKLSPEQILAGDNITVTNNDDGTVTISSSGGSETGENAFAGQNSPVNLTPTAIAVIDTFYPITAGFTAIQSSNFVSELRTISGVLTPTFRYTDNDTQFFNIAWNLSAEATTSAGREYIFEIFILRADGVTIVPTGYTGNAKLFNTVDSLSISAVPIVALAELNTGDCVFMQVKCLTLNTPVTVKYYNAVIKNVASAAGGSAAVPTAESNIFYPGNFTSNPWQRGVSFTMSSGSSPNSVSADRIHHLQGLGGGTVTVTREEDAPTVEECGYLPRYSHKTTVTVAHALASNSLLGHTIWLTFPEYSKIAFQDFVVSFWVKSSTVGVYSLAIFSSDRAAGCVSEYTITDADTWQKIDIPIPARLYEYPEDRSASVGLYVNFIHAAGSAFYTSNLGVWTYDGDAYYASPNQVDFFATEGNYISYESIKIETGTVATQYVPYSDTEVLIDCQAHYEKSYSLGVDPGAVTTDGVISIGVGAATTLNLLMTVQYKVSKFNYGALPTVVLYDGAGNAGKITKGIDNQDGNVDFSGLNGFTVGSNSAQSSSGMYCHFTSATGF